MTQTILVLDVKHYNIIYIQSMHVQREAINVIHHFQDKGSEISAVCHHLLSSLQATDRERLIRKVRIVICKGHLTQL